MAQSAGNGLDADVLVLGAGAAGLMCAIEAGRRGRRVLVVDHARKPAEKIRISGGGRCNFTHLAASPKNFLSQNPSFCVSALKRFTARDFLGRVEAAGIPWTEKTPGQLFCARSARDIIDMLLGQLAEAGGRLELGVRVGQVTREADGFAVSLEPSDCAETVVRAGSLVVATGGLSIPAMGATGLAYDLARQFGLEVIPTRPALVPFTLGGQLREAAAALAGVSVEADVACGGASFADGLLFTHRGLSGPAVLQASSYWREGEEVRIDLAAGRDVMAELKALRSARGKLTLPNALALAAPKRLAQAVADETHGEARLADLSDARLAQAAARLKAWRVTPAGTEGYRTAEVTLGGVDTAGLSSRTLEATRVPGLYFIGECVDVTGWLGGYNFQWAWSSGWAAGQAC